MDFDLPKELVVTETRQVHLEPETYKLELDKMCGIFGAVSYGRKPDLVAVANEAILKITHRGPDAGGTYVSNNVALGHRRLSILDLEGGRQPMSSEDGSLYLTYNGEIYNFKELRKELSQLGYRFATSSDTEVVLYAYEEWGRFCVERFEGMFSFAILDLNRREVMLARDHFGIKPLLYRILPDNFVFASEFSSLKCLPDWSGEVDLHSIDLFLRYQYIPAPNTAFRNVFKLPAGHRMVVSIDEPRISIERYWHPDFTKKKKRSLKTLLEELDECLKDSVKRHLVSDVPFGAFLSGGIDSSLVVGYMSELLDHSVETFSIGFDDNRFSEVEYARRVATKYRTKHHEEILSVRAFDALPDIVRHHGEPFGDQSSIATWALSRLARCYVPMALSGDGGDELFAGYSYYGCWLKYLGSQSKEPVLKRTVATARKVRNLLTRRQPRSVPIPNDELQQWYPLTGRFSDHCQRSKLWRPELRFVSDFPSISFQQAWQKSKNFTRINQAQCLDLQTFLPEDILTKVDIASMSVGLEVRPPILDRRVFELAASIPEESLYCHKDEYCGKLPLKLLAERKLGSDFAFRKKQGFEIPLETWLRGDQERKEQLERSLADPIDGLGEWFSPSEISKLVNRDSAYKLWQLVVLQEWKRQNS